jgi:catechol 2,3-dioxygenase-like lactoylglutathione lyase family enzyme
MHTGSSKLQWQLAGFQSQNRCMTPGTVAVMAYEHVGIRVSERQRALRFYATLGFRLTEELPEHDALELRNGAGVVLNLIVNAVERAHARNVLIDDPIKLPGVTHSAFVVSNLDETIAMLQRAGIALSEGPIDLGRRRVCFVRDPDGTVIEFDELKGKEAP